MEPNRSHSQPLKTWRKVGFASLELPVTAIELVLQLYLIEFYIRTCGLSPLFASSAIAIAIIWDAITDPIIGQFSDKCKSYRFGKRIGFIFPGSILLSIAISCLFLPPQGLDQLPLMLWLLLSYIAVNTGMTFVTVPHIAAVGDYATSSNNRNVLLGWRMLFANIGLILAVVLPPLSSKIDAGFYDINGGIFILSGLLLLFSLVCARSLYDVPLAADRDGSALLSQSNPTHNNHLQNLIQIFKNRAFVILLGAFFIIGIARALNGGLALFYYTDTLKLDQQSDVAVILLVFILSIIVSIPLWILIGKHLKKSTSAFVGILTLGLLTISTYAFFPSGSLTGPMAMAVAGGLAVGSILLVESMVIDAIDADAKRVGFRRDGIYFGIWKMFGKIARAFGMIWIGPILVWINYDKTSDTQTADTAAGLGNVFGFGVGSIFLAGALLFLLLLKPRSLPQS